MNLLLKPVPHKEAIAFVKDKPAMVRETFDKLLPELKARAFTVTGIGNANTLQRIRDRIADIPAGADWNAVKQDVIAQALPFFVDPEADLETQAKQAAAADRRAETILRKETFQAYQAAQYEVLDRQRDVFPFWQYLTMEDDSVRPEHEALDQLVLPADSPFWAIHYPPWDWGCRCQVVPLMQDDVDAITSGQADGRVLPESQQTRLEETGDLYLPNSGQMINVTPRPGAMQWKPGNLRIPLEELTQNLDPEVRKIFEAEAAKQTVDGQEASVLDWLKGMEFRS